jgi:3-oxoadipate enol-lactonase
MTFDVRGHGFSEHGDEDLSIDLFVRDLIGLMDFLNIKSAQLCGLSMGGYIALKAVQNHPDRFDSLILCDTQCHADSPEGKEKRLKAIKNITENGVEGYAEESLKNLFAPASFNTRQKEVAAIRSMILDTSEKTLCNTLTALMNREETCSGLENIKIPVLIIVGKEDKLIPPPASKFMHEKINGSVYIEIEEAGHITNLENPDDFNSQLKRFLKAQHFTG